VFYGCYSRQLVSAVPAAAAAAAAAAGDGDGEDEWLWHSSAVSGDWLEGQC